MILHWSELVACYGTDVVEHQKSSNRQIGQRTQCYAAVFSLESASRCQRHTACGGRVAPPPGLAIGSPAALRTMRPSREAVTLWALVKNRSPCRECTKVLISGLNDLAIRVHAMFPEIQFILACRGAYLGKAEEDGDGEDGTGKRPRRVTSSAWTRLGGVSACFRSGTGFLYAGSGCTMRSSGCRATCPALAYQSDGAAGHARSWGSFFACSMLRLPLLRLDGREGRDVHCADVITRATKLNARQVGVLAERLAS